MPSSTVPFDMLARAEPAQSPAFSETIRLPNLAAPRCWHEIMAREKSLFVGSPSVSVALIQKLPQQFRAAVRAFSIHRTARAELHGSCDIDSTTSLLQQRLVFRDVPYIREANRWSLGDLVAVLKLAQSILITGARFFSNCFTVARRSGLGRSQSAPRNRNSPIGRPGASCRSNHLDRFDDLLIASSGPDDHSAQTLFE